MHQLLEYGIVNPSTMVGTTVNWTDISGAYSDIVKSVNSSESTVKVAGILIGLVRY